MARRKIHVIDFFSGCGGTSAGLQQAGMNIVAGIDNDPDSAASFRANFPAAQFFERDVAELSTEAVKKIVPKSGYILFAGCAPCQPFSTQNREKDVNDPSRLLLLEFLRFVVALRPHFVVVENVPGLQNVDDSEHGPFKKFVSALKAEGYEVKYEVLRALDFGVPQTRKRLVLIASILGVPSLPTPTHGSGRLPVSTVRDWIHGMPQLAAGSADPRDEAHASMKLSKQNLERIQATPMGLGRESWPERLRLECHDGFSGHSDVYGRLSWDRPAAGLTTRCISYSNGRFGHPVEDRAISAREAALLQTFPRDYQFVGTLTSKARQVGNAVPPLLARRIGESVNKVSASASIRPVTST